MSKMKITGYSIMDIAKHVKMARFRQDTFRKAHCKGKTFEQLWEGDAMYVKSDLRYLAALAKAEGFYYGYGGFYEAQAKAVREALIAQKHGLPLHTIEVSS